MVVGGGRLLRTHPSIDNNSIFCPEASLGSCFYFRIFFLSFLHNKQRAMGFFQRYFQRRSTKTHDNDYFLDSDRKQQKQKQGRRSRPSSPEEERDEIYVDGRLTKTSASNGGVMESMSSEIGRRSTATDPLANYSYNELSRISEEQTVSSSTSGRPTLHQTLPPPARVAAFHGPPRFDWMDIVSLSSYCSI